MGNYFSVYGDPKPRTKTSKGGKINLYFPGAIFTGLMLIILAFIVDGDTAQKTFASLGFVSLTFGLYFFGLPYFYENERKKKHYNTK